MNTATSVLLRTPNNWKTADVIPAQHGLWRPIWFGASMGFGQYNAMIPAWTIVNESGVIPVTITHWWDAPDGDVPTMRPDGLPLEGVA